MVKGHYYNKEGTKVIPIVQGTTEEAPMEFPKVSHTGPLSSNPKTPIVPMAKRTEEPIQLPGLFGIPGKGLHDHVYEDQKKR